jgi:hypothetical protein
MLVTIAALALNAGPDERSYQLRVHGDPGTRVALRVSGVHGWVEAFCTSKVCSVGHVVTAIPESGTDVVKLSVYRIDESAPHTGRVTVTSDHAPQVTLDVAIR